MPDTLEILNRHGGIAHVRTLDDAGVRRHDLYRLVSSGLIERVRTSWYALPTASPLLKNAARIGGRISCVSALTMHGVWCLSDRRLHISAAHNRNGLRAPSPHPQPLGAPERWGVTVHYDRVSGQRARYPLDSVLDALVHAVSCQTRENALVSIDSALNRRMLRMDELPTLRGRVPRKYAALVDAADGGCQSGLETMCRLRLLALGIHYRTQVAIGGVGHVDVLVGDRLVIELDGIGYHSGAAVEEDRRRDLELHRRGFIVLRVSYSMVMSGWATVEAVIRGYVARREHLWSARHMRAGLG